MHLDAIIIHVQTYSKKKAKKEKEHDGSTINSTRMLAFEW